MEEKSREDVLAERKLRKAAKQSKKKPVATKQSDESDLKNSADVNDLSKKLHQVKITPELSQISSTPKTSVPTSDTPSPSSAHPVVVVSKSSKCANAPNECSSIPNECKQSQGTSKSKEKSSQKSSPLEVAISEDENVKSKSQLKAERRAKQDAQRAQKAQKKTNEITEQAKPSSKVEPQTLRPKSKPKSSRAATDPHKVKVFSHLYRNSSVEENKILASCSTVIHKSVVHLGVQYKEKIIIGGNARVIAFLNTLRQVIADYKTPTATDFSRGFEIVLQDTVQYLNHCRPISVSIENAAKYLKLHLAALHSESNITDQKARDSLRARIEQYMREEIDKAGEAICIMVQKKISENDVILTFGYSSLIERILTESFQTGLKFRVIIVDAGPMYEGKELLRRLVKSGLHCVYVLLAATSYIMKEATKVLLGAHAILTNGYVMSRAGSSQVALIANSYNVPVLVCCETHKFSERVQTDAFVYNELGDPEKLLETDVWKSNAFLTPLTLMYDVTPSDLVTAVVTELAILPCTSVPVILRVKPVQPAYPSSS